jgi:hypothetical protein
MTNYVSIGLLGHHKIKKISRIKKFYWCKTLGTFKYPQGGSVLEV